MMSVECNHYFTFMPFFTFDCPIFIAHYSPYFTIARLIAQIIHVSIAVCRHSSYSFFTPPSLHLRYFSIFTTFVFDIIPHMLLLLFFTYSCHIITIILLFCLQRCHFISATPTVPRAGKRGGASARCYYDER